MKKQSNSNLTFKKQFGTTISKGTEGITLVALVITVIIIIILSTVAISFLFGENGLITKAQQAKLEQEIATARETLTMVLGDAFAEKKINPAYDQNEFLDKFIEAREPNVYLDKDEIGLDGHIFGLDRSVPELGEYQGELTGPRIKEIKVLEETTNSASIEVITVNAEGATYTYSYKNENEGEDQWKKVETDNKSNTCTINGLTQGEIYNIRVVVTTNDGSATRETNVYLGEIPEGTIIFTNQQWEGDGTATVAINTIETEYTLQYQVVGEGQIVDTNWTTVTPGETITGLHHGETVYGRLFDGTNESKDYGSVTIKDEENPIVNVTSGGITTNSITVNVVATDGQSGMVDNVTYTYYIKQSSQDDSNYTVPEGVNNITNINYTFTGLTQGTSYDIKVEANGDKAGNIGIGTVTNLNTGTVGGAEGGLTQGNIIASSPTWTEGKASITLTTNTGLQIQYQVGSTTGNWTTIQSGGQVTGINHNDTVYARLWDGNNAGSEASVTIKDTIAPSKVTINSNGAVSGTWTNSDVRLDLSSTDAETGIAKYQMTGDDGATWYDCSTPYVVSSDWQCRVKFRAIDNAGNVGEVSDSFEIKIDKTGPEITNYWYGEVNLDTVSLYVQVADNGSGINRVECPTSTEEGGYTDWIWLSTVWDASANAYRADIRASDFNKYNTYYRTHVYAYDNLGNSNAIALDGQEKYLSKPYVWTTYVNKPAAASVTLREPSSEASPTILNVASYADQDIGAHIIYNGYVEAGSEITMTYMTNRSNNSFYLDFVLNHQYTYAISRSYNNQIRTYTTTVQNAMNSLAFGLHKSDSTSTSIYGTMYIYDISINGQKVL